ncbi:response regulator [Alicyclobacillus acidiphilus]|jgi:two-component system response regulator DegU|uniref:response regulator n=1 Tax=Alicyclobacillus acidiphilus TaxID=182455 RepID=UPI00082E3333|nr:response regulator transcription factor [Alicyclobacillus acidiphilus]
MQTQSNVSVAIADDNEEFRLTLRDFLAYEPGIEVVGLWSNGQEVLDEIGSVRPDILLLDITMPKVSGVEVVRALKMRNCSSKIIILTMHDTANVVLETLRDGASGYIIKDGAIDDVVRAIREVNQGNALVHPQVMPVLLGEMRRSHTLNPSWQSILTAREYDVLCEMASGKSNEQISETLHISLKTAKNHVSHILAKLDVTDRAQAVLHAVRERWIDL